MNDELNTLELECGITLELKKANRMLLADCLGDVVGADGKIDPKKMTLALFNDLMRYIGGWCVTTDIPPDERADYEIFGNGPRQRRSAWVREIATEPELSQLMGQVMALTALGDTQQPDQPRPKPEQDELDELRAKVAQLESEKTEDGK